jgi:hypothetical protein
MCKVSTFSLYFEIPTIPTNDCHLIFKTSCTNAKKFWLGLGHINSLHSKLSNVGLSKWVESSKVNIECHSWA